MHECSKSMGAVPVKITCNGFFGRTDMRCKQRLGNATAEECANYCVTLFSDLTKMVTMQNLFHDGGFSFTGVSVEVMEQMEK